MHRLGLLLLLCVFAAPMSAQNTASYVQQEMPSLLTTYKSLYAHPELSRYEESTSAVVERLRKASYAVSNRIDVYPDDAKAHGVAGILKNGASPTLLIRGNMGAMPIVEEIGLPYESHVPSRNQADQEDGGPTKTPLRLSCTCDNKLSERLADNFSDHLAADPRYIEAADGTVPAWKVSLDTVLVYSSDGSPTSLALSIAVTRQGQLVDQWAAYCAKENLEACSLKLLHDVEKDIDISDSADADAAEKAEEAAGPISRPNTGDNIIPPVGAAGKDVLKFSCSAKLDSLVLVANSSGQIVRAIYVRANETATVVPGLPSGSYSIRVAQGDHFHLQTRTFTRLPEYFKFPRLVTFTETDQSYVEHSYTLNDPHGNLTPIPISAGEFWNNMTVQTPIQTSY